MVCNSGCPERLTSGDGPSSYNASSSCTNGEAIGEATRVGGVAGTSPGFGKSGLSLLPRHLPQRQESAKG